jgi:SAM-dependent methyltransferase
VAGRNWGETDVGAVSKWHSFVHDRVPPGRTMETHRARWRDQTDPARWARTLTQMPQYAAELRVLLEEVELQRVLEIGCGDGALFAELGFDESKYRGVDFSPAMLRRFRSLFPNSHLVEADGSTYEDRQTYDLIFSNEVVQNFDLAMLESHIALARKMLAPEGRLIIGSVLWRRRRWEYCSAKFDTNLPTAASIKRHLRVLLRMRLLGAWYNPPEIEALGGRHGFEVEIFGSMVCMYRFHAVLRPR